MGLLEHAGNQGVKDGILNAAKGDYLDAAAALDKGILVDLMLRRVPGLGNLLKKGNAMASITPSPKIPKAFPNLSRAKPKTSAQGGGGLRKRWKDEKGNIYEWDSQHRTIEMYNKRGKHLGEFNAEIGEKLKDAVSGRTVEP